MVTNQSVTCKPCEYNKSKKIPYTITKMKAGCISHH